MLGFLAVPVQAVPAYNGMSYTPWSSADATSTGADQSMLNLRVIGANTVALNVFWFQDNIGSTSITQDTTRYSITQTAARHAIQDIRARGMNVILKPQVDVRDGSWRGQINPSVANRAAWFASYGNFVNTWADVAQQEGAIGLSVGTEMNAVQGLNTQWQTVITDARSRFGGTLTYSANWDAYQSVPFWSALDSIGIDAYFPLAAINNPTPTQLRTSWTNLANTIGNWRTASGLSERIIFSEVGYRSVDGAVKAPWEFTSGGTVDLQEQADAYDALLSVMTQQSWFDGAFFWNWVSNPLAGGALDTDFTPQNKPAQTVLASYYVPEPSALVWLTAAACLLRRRQRRSPAAAPTQIFD